MLGILDAHAVPRASFVAHSFGTFFARCVGGCGVGVGG